MRLSHRMARQLETPPLETAQSSPPETQKSPQTYSRVKVQLLSSSPLRLKRTSALSYTFSFELGPHGATNMDSAILQVENLVKRYGDVEAVRDVSFSVDEGEVFGLLG